MRLTLQKIATVIWGRNPSPTISVSVLLQNSAIGRTDIESAPYRNSVPTVNLRSKIITNYALRITH